MPAKGVTMAMTEDMRQKVYATARGATKDIRVPFTEVHLAGDNPPVRIYDTSGPGSDPRNGLPPLRRPWIVARGDVEEYTGRPVDPRDDGRAAMRSGPSTSVFAGERRP